MKKFITAIFIIFLAAVIISSIYVYINRATIFDYSLNRILKNIIPRYAAVEEVKVDLDKRIITINNFAIINPRGSKNEYLIKVAKISCNYSQRNEKNILKGIRLANIEFSQPLLLIERAEDSHLNIQRMNEVFRQDEKPKKAHPAAKIAGFFWYLFSPVKNIDEFLEFDPVFKLKDAKFIFDDYVISEKGYMTSIEYIDATVKLNFGKGFNDINYIETEGLGFVNGYRSQVVEWSTGYNPKASRLTMSNTFKIRDVDFIHFAPYYDRFSPLIFKDGTASGELIFNFDNGEIGSTNEIRFLNPVIEPKKGYTSSDMWDIGINELYRYFSSESGEIVFDFKIKGPMEKPKFYLGPKTKRALAMMIVDKVADTLLKQDGDSAGAPAPGSPAEEKSDLEKVIDIFKNLKKSD